MKLLIAAIGLLISISSYCQKYTVGLLKNGAKVENVEGQIMVTDSTVVSTINGQSSTLKITSRKGYTIHVTDGEFAHKYVISHAAGRLHGFTYDCSIKYELDKRHSPGPHPIYLCKVQRDK